MDNVIDLIGVEHRNLARVLNTLQIITDRLESDPHPGDVDRLFDICQYVRVFPDKVHHPKEEQYIFGPLRDIAPEHRELLDKVQDQHDQCAELTGQLYRAVRGFDNGNVSAAELRRITANYLKFQFDHMRIEEREVLPLAESLLGASMWASASQAFFKHGDPMFGDNIESGFAALRERIVHAA